MVVRFFRPGVLGVIKPLIRFRDFGLGFVRSDEGQVGIYALQNAVFAGPGRP